MKWALTYTFNYDKNEAQFFESFDDAKQEAFFLVRKRIRCCNLSLETNNWQPY